MFKVFLKTTGLSFLLAFVILWPPTDKLTVRLFILIAIFIWLLVRTFLNKKNYLSAITFVDDAISIRYTTAQLITKTLHLNINDIDGIKLSASNYPYSHAGSLRIYTNAQWHTYLIMDKRLFKSVEQELKMANTAFAEYQV